jgi:hypothetical protein
MDAMNETAFGTWTAPASPVDIEYSMVVIDEIRRAVTEGFQRLSRGGIEVGGILYGTVEGRRLRIMAVREMVCEHARGPTFHLSENDQGLLAAQLERERDDPRLSGMVAVGWYLSHTRSEITLQQSDLDTYNAFFPEPWQVTMVIRPGRAQAMRAGFFVRESDGAVKTDQSYHDFPFPDRPAGFVDRPSRERLSPAMAPPERSGSFRTDGRIDARFDAPMDAPLEGPPDLAPETGAHAPPAAGYRQPLRPGPPSWSPSAYPGAPRKLPWTAITVVVVGVVAAIVGMRFFGPRLNSEPLGLTVSERAGQLRIQWNRASNSVANATAASIEISDGDADNKQIVNLTGPQLTDGSYTYARKTGDVRVRMTVSGAGGSVTEGSRFLGNPPEVAPDPTPQAPDVSPTAAAPTAVPTKEQRDAQQEEIDRLREENSQQAERIRRLERTLTILRSRLGISDAP